jgi:glycosyltransferase involved in cell wall biosynthesis
VSDPAVTFVIPFFRGLDHLDAAIRSVRAQTVGAWRALVIDDAGPEPESSARVAAFADPRIEHRRNPENLGLAGNWNLGLELASTDLVTILHADDELEPGYAAAVLAGHARHPEAAAVYTQVTVIGTGGHPVFSFPDYAKRFVERRGEGDAVVAGEAGLDRLMHGQFIFCPSLCYRRSRVGAAPFDGRWRQVLDLDLLADLLLRDEQLVGVPERVYRYRRHGSSLTAQQTESLLRFEEELAIFDEIATRAQERGWSRAARTAEAKRIVRLNLLYRAAQDAVRGRWTAARGKVRLARS